MIALLTQLTLSSASADTADGIIHYTFTSDHPTQVSTEGYYDGAVGAFDSVRVSGSPTNTPVVAGCRFIIASDGNSSFNYILRDGWSDDPEEVLLTPAYGETVVAAEIGTSYFVGGPDGSGGWSKGAHSFVTWDTDGAPSGACAAASLSTSDSSKGVAGNFEVECCVEYPVCTQGPSSSDDIMGFGIDEIEAAVETDFVSISTTLDGAIKFDHFNSYAEECHFRGKPTGSASVCIDTGRLPLGLAVCADIAATTQQTCHTESSCISPPEENCNTEEACCSVSGSITGSVGVEKELGELDWGFWGAELELEATLAGNISAGINGSTDIGVPVGDNQCDDSLELDGGSLGLTAKGDFEGEVEIGLFEVEVQANLGVCAQVDIGDDNVAGGIQAEVKAKLGGGVEGGKVEIGAMIWKELGAASFSYPEGYECL